jgi:Putative translation initiation inhibitor, yjgF family
MAGDVLHINPATVAAPGGHYSHAVRAKDFVFISGQLPIALDGTKLNEATFEQQAQQALDNVAQALAASGSSIAALTQVRIYVTDIKSWPAFDAIYAAWAGSIRPARAVVPVPELHYGFKIEVEAVAMNLTAYPSRHPRHRQPRVGDADRSTQVRSESKDIRRAKTELQRRRAR